MIKSHTRVLLERIERERMFGTSEGRARQIVALAEYFRDNTEIIEERDTIVTMEVLNGFFHEDNIVLNSLDEEFNSTVMTVLETRAGCKAACIRCGRVLSQEQSVVRRMGPSCFAKVGNGDWDFKGEPTTVDERKDFMRENDIKQFKDKTRLGLSKMAKHFNVSLSVIRRDRRELKKEIMIEEEIQTLYDNIIEGPVFDDSIKCPIYKRKGDGTHCKKQCKNSVQ